MPLVRVVLGPRYAVRLEMVQASDVIDATLLGGIIAAGMGSLSMAVVARWLDLPPEAVAAGSAAGSAAYLVGVFGPAFIEVALARLRAGKGAAGGGGDA